MSEDLVKKVRQLLPEIYKGLKDKSGVAYFSHPYSVMLSLPVNASDDVQIAALLHDVYEDTDFDPATLGISDESLEMIKILTRKPDESYSEYIIRIIVSKNRGALLVKYVDLYHNLQPFRIMALDRETRDRLFKKYLPALQAIAFALQ